MIVKIPLEQMCCIGHTVRVGCNLALKDKNITARKSVTQMIIGAAIPQAQLQHRCTAQINQASQFTNCPIQAGALGLQTTNGAIQSAHLKIVLRPKCRSTRAIFQLANTLVGLG